MMSKPQVTILVAVWNTAAYLPQCLESLRRQTLRDIQVVCVDDASTDESLAVLRHYADLDDGHMDAYNRIYEYAVMHGYRFLCLTSSPDADIERWKDLTGAEYPFCQTDQLIMNLLSR